MKKLLLYFRDYFKEGVSIPHHIYTLVFIACAITINYIVDFEDSIIDPHFKTPQGILYYMLFYFTAYLFVLIPGLFITRKSSIMKNPELWIKIFVFVGLIGLMAGFYQYHYLLEYFKGSSEYSFMRKLMMNLKRFIPYIALLFIIQRIFDKGQKGIYGFHLKNVNIKPYLILLCLVVPLIVWASFQEDFLKAYPRWRYWNYDSAFGMPVGLMGLFYELCYGLDFISTELIFRGALVIGMVRILGKEAILPMVSVYAFLHFGKPLGETISSVFGGYILGVLAYYSRNIWGGIVIHLGVAYLMEGTALVQHYFAMKP